MHRKTERILVASYVGFFGALAATGVWAQQMVSSMTPGPRLAAVSLTTTRDKAPDFALKDVDGNEVTLAGLRGEASDRVVVLEWFDPRCDWVRTYHGASTTMRDLYNEYHTSGVQWVAIYSSTPPEGTEAAELNKKAAQEWGITYPVLLDSDRATAVLYKVERAPHVIVVSAEGEIIYSGAIDDSTTPGTAGTQNHLRHALEAAVQGKAPDIGRMPGPGCRLEEKEPGRP